MRWPTIPVRVRILAAILVVTAVGMGVAGGISFVVQRERVLSQVDARLTDTASRLRTIAGETDFPSVRALLVAAVQQITPDTNEGVLGIIDGASAVVPGSQVGVPLEKESALISRIDKETRAGGVVIGTAVTGTAALRYIAVPVRASGDSATGVYVAAFSVDAVLAPIAEAFTTFLIVSGVALVVIAVVGWFVAGRLLRPIRRLRETAERITESDLGERIEVYGRDDVSDLARTVNAMLDRMQEAIVGQRRLLDDVGHELRTPLTIVRGHLELMDPADAEQVVATRELTLDEVDRMRSLVADISLLASARRDTAVAPAPTDIGTLTTSVFEKASALGDRDWVLEGSADAVAPIDENRITQAWLQLAANAERYATPGTSVFIGSRVVEEPNGWRARLWVRDLGPGIPADQQERVFERFRRGTEGRGDSGSGLGLSIVSAIAAGHGGRVMLESEPGAGSTFTIDLPLERDA